MEAYFQHVIPEPQTLLGLELKPFCAGHIALLHRTQSVFVLGGEVDTAQIVNAVFLCAQSFEIGCASLNDEATPKFMVKWGKKIGTFDLIEKKKAFEDYMERGSKFEMSFVPKTDSTPANGSLTKMPFVHSVRCALKHFYHTGESEFWNMPWGLALWDYFTIPVLNGTGDLMETNKIQDIRNLADELAKNWTDEKPKEPANG